MKIPATHPARLCRTCGRQATHGVADLREIEPVRGGDGRPYRRWELTGLYDFCDEHTREPVRLERVKP